MQRLGSAGINITKDFAAIAVYIFVNTYTNT